MGCIVVGSSRIVGEGMNTTSLGHIEVRDAEDAPGSRFDGLAVPYGIPIEVSYGRETFVRGAFADALRADAVVVANAGFGLRPCVSPSHRAALPKNALRNY